MNFPFQRDFAGNAAAKFAVLPVRGLVTTDPVTKQYSGAPSPKDPSATSATPWTVLGIPSGPTLGMSRITISAGAAACNMADVHPDIAAVAGFARSIATPTTTSHRNESVSTRI
jgi:hypothetical protein